LCRAWVTIFLHDMIDWINMTYLYFKTCSCLMPKGYKTRRSWANWYPDWLIDWISVTVPASFMTKSQCWKFIPQTVHEYRIFRQETLDHFTREHFLALSTVSGDKCVHGKRQLMSIEYILYNPGSLARRKLYRQSGECTLPSANSPTNYPMGVSTRSLTYVFVRIASCWMAGDRVYGRCTLVSDQL
jgi:hypothetical protein